MKLSFDIPTPKNCMECRFKLVTTEKRYGKWVIKCMIDPEVVMEPKKALEGRCQNCPGKETE